MDDLVLPEAELLVSKHFLDEPGLCLLGPPELVDVDKRFLLNGLVAIVDCDGECAGEGVDEGVIDAIAVDLQLVAKSGVLFVLLF